MSSSATTLYTYWRSSASWRVRIALNLKNIPYEPKFVRLASKGGDQLKPSFLELNPSAQVPVLFIDGERLCESVPILEYLEETRPQPPLLPSTPAERAKVRMLVEMINAGIQPKQNLSVITFVADNFGGEAARLKFAKHMVEKGMRAVETVLQTTSGKYCVGDAITFADVLLVPQCGSLARFGIDSKQFPTIMRIVAQLEKVQAFAQAQPSAQPDAQI